MAIKWRKKREEQANSHLVSYIPIHLNLNTSANGLLSNVNTPNSLDNAVNAHIRIRSYLPLLTQNLLDQNNIDMVDNSKGDSKIVALNTPLSSLFNSDHIIINNEAIYLQPTNTKYQLWIVPPLSQNIEEIEQGFIRYLLTWGFATYLWDLHQSVVDELENAQHNTNLDNKALETSDTSPIDIKQITQTLKTLLSNPIDSPSPLINHLNSVNLNIKNPNIKNSNITNHTVNMQAQLNVAKGIIIITWGDITDLVLWQIEQINQLQPTLKKECLLVMLDADYTGLVPDMTLSLKKSDLKQPKKQLNIKPKTFYKKLNTYQYTQKATALLSIISEHNAPNLVPKTIQLFKDSQSTDVTLEIVNNTHPNLVQNTDNLYPTWNLIGDWLNRRTLDSIA